MLGGQFKVAYFNLLNLRPYSHHRYFPHDVLSTWCIFHTPCPFTSVVAANSLMDMPPPLWIWAGLWPLQPIKNSRVNTTWFPRLGSKRQGSFFLVHWNDLLELLRQQVRNATMLRYPCCVEAQATWKFCIGITAIIPAHHLSPGCQICLWRSSRGSTCSCQITFESFQLKL